MALLSRMATLFPAQMASRLRSLLDTVCAAAAGSEGFSAAGGGGGGGARVALRQTQKAVQSVVPALKAHGAEAGVGAHFVVEVCGVVCLPITCSQECAFEGTCPESVEQSMLSTHLTFDEC